MKKLKTILSSLSTIALLNSACGDDTRLYKVGSGIDGGIVEPMFIDASGDGGMGSSETVKCNNIRYNIPPDCRISFEIIGGLAEPWTAYFYRTTFQKIKHCYGNQLKLRFLHFPFDSPPDIPYASNAAMAAECARDQGQFWEYLDELLIDNSGKLTISDLRSHAESIGLVMDRFNTTFDSGVKREVLHRHLQEIKGRGITNGVPRMYINYGKPGQAEVYGGNRSFSLYQELFAEACRVGK